MGEQWAITDAMRDYVDRSSTPLDPALSGLIAETSTVGTLSAMALSAGQAALFSMLSQITAASLVVDIGTFTGVSALAFAKGLVPGGKVITCDVTDEWLGTAKKYWESAGVADRIDFRLGAATRTLRELPEETNVDIAFIDADKMNYGKYYDLLLPRLRPGGLLLADNVLLDGYVMDPDLAEEKLLRRSAGALREFNARVAADDRVDAVMLPIVDGLTIVRKKEDHV